MTILGTEFLNASSQNPLYVERFSGSDWSCCGERTSVQIQEHCTYQYCLVVF